MSLILTKIQFIRQGTTDLESGEIPYYEKDGKFFLKENDQEVTIEKEEVIIF